AAGTRPARHHPLLLRGAQAPADRGDPRPDRVTGLADPVESGRDPQGSDAPAPQGGRMSGARNERATRSVSASVGMRAPVPGFALVLALALVFSPAASGARALAAAPAQAEPGTPGSPAGSPETLVAELSRRAMEDSDDPAAWAELARGLALLRPEGWKDFPSAAERAALRVADSLAAATPGALKELRVEPRDGRTEVAVRVTGPVSYRL